jgi:hypothetical protein
MSAVLRSTIAAQPAPFIPKKAFKQTVQKVLDPNDFVDYGRTKSLPAGAAMEVQINKTPTLVLETGELLVQTPKKRVVYIPAVRLNTKISRHGRRSKLFRMSSSEFPIKRETQPDQE